MKQTRWLALFLIWALILTGCASNDSPETRDDDDPDGDASDGDGENPDGDEPDGDTPDGDNDTDGDTDGDESEPLELPYVPPAMENPMVDTIYLQEYNHTTNEIEPGVGELVAVVLPPAAFTDLDSPLWVTPRGVVDHDTNGALTSFEIPSEHADLIAAAVSGDAILLASPDSLYGLQNDGSLHPIAAPESLTILGLANGPDRIFVLTDQGILDVTPGKAFDWIPRWPDMTAVTSSAAGTVVANANGLYVYPSLSTRTETPSVTFEPADGLGVGALKALVADVSLPDAYDVILIGEDGLRAVRIDDATDAVTLVDPPEFAADRVPLLNPRLAARASDGGFVVITAESAYRLMERGSGPEWRVYNYERWLPSDDLRGLALTDSIPDSPLYFATAAGPATVTARRITLEEKFDHFIQRIVDRHDRDGAVADSRLSVRGDLASSVSYDSDNDGGWTCYWVLSECFRYQVTGDAEAKAHFDKSLERMLSLQTLTGTDHFLARSVIRKDGCQLDDCDGPDDGEWFTSPDGEWWVKGDTSNDEVTSHMFMMAHAYDLCADADQQAAIRQHVSRIIGGIIDNGYQLNDIDGECTTYGQFDPFYVNEWVEGAFGDGGRRSAQILAALSLAYYMTGDEKFMDAKRYLMDEHHYGDNVVRESEYQYRKGSGDGDELGTQAFFVLLRYESDPELRAKWLEGWRRSYGNTRLQQAALWDMVNAVLGGDDPQLENAMRWFQLTPMDMIRWNLHNEHRQDLVTPPAFYEDNGATRSDGYIVPYDERRTERWNTDQYNVEGGMGGWREMDGADALMPYWLGRYYGFIVPEEK